MGRVYCLNPAAEGERDGAGCRVYDHQGSRIAGTFRVAFLADADEGEADVTAYASFGGVFVVDLRTGRPAESTFRTWVTVVPRGGEAPAADPEAWLLRDADGTLARIPGDALTPKLDPALAEVA